MISNPDMTRMEDDHREELAVVGSMSQLGDTSREFLCLMQMHKDHQTPMTMKETF